MSDTPKTDELISIYIAKRDFVPDGLWIRHARELERENAALLEDKDAYFKHNNILVKLMTEEQKKKALEILMSRPKEAKESVTK